MEAQDKQKVMVVDDSIFICSQIRSVLQEDTELCEAHSGQEALEVLRQNQPDLILLDIILPDIEGYELCKKIQAEKSQDTVIIFLTSMDSEEDVIKGFSVGACDYIKKPFKAAELKSRVIAHLRLKRQKDELKKMNNELRTNMDKLNYMAFRDGLTGLYNRRYVQDDLVEEIRSHGREDVKNFLVMSDIDNFKKINDTYGHDAGDVALVCVSNIMENACRRHRVIRWGGEEFLVVLFAVTKEEAFETCEQIRRDVQDFKIVHGDAVFSCTITLGICQYRGEGSVEENVVLADKALYWGKHHGKNQCVWYEEIEKMER